MSRETELKQYVRASGKLIDRLNESRLRIAKMCSERRGPRMSIPVEWSDDDFFICLTLEDAVAKLSEQQPSIRPNLLRDETSEWEVQTSDIDGNPVVTCHTRVIGGVLCRWWGDEAPPSGVELIDQAAAIKVVTLDGETGIHVACGPAGQDAKQFSGRDVQEMTAIAFALRKHREAKAQSAVLLPSDRNPLLDAISWLGTIPPTNGNFLNAQATMAHLTGMVGRLRNAATKATTQCDHGVSLSIPCELCRHQAEPTPTAVHPTFLIGDIVEWIQNPDHRLKVVSNSYTCQYLTSNYCHTFPESELRLVQKGAHQSSAEPIKNIEALVDELQKAAAECALREYAPSWEHTDISAAAALRSARAAVLDKIRTATPPPTAVIQEDPFADVRWICPNCTTVNATDAARCVGCRMGERPSAIKPADGPHRRDGESETGAPQ